MAAIAEEAMRRFRREADEALKDSAAEPLARVRAMGVAYLRWVNDADLVELAGRAMVCGFARMKIDGHFPRWGVKDADAEHLGEAILDLFIAGVEKRD